MPTREVKLQIDRATDPILQGVYRIGAEVLVGAYVSANHSFLTLDYDIAGGIQIPFEHDGDALPRMLGAIKIDRQTFLRIVPFDRITERRSFQENGIAYFPERHEATDFDQELNQFLGSVRGARVTGLIPALARKIVDRIYPDYDDRRGETVPPIHREAVQARMAQLDIDHVMAECALRVVHRNEPLLILFRDDHYHVVEVGMFWELQDIDF